MHLDGVQFESGRTCSALEFDVKVVAGQANLAFGRFEITIDRLDLYAGMPIEIPDLIKTSSILQSRLVTLRA